MKSKTDPFLLRVIKEHLPYITVIAVMCLLIIFSFFIFQQKYAEIDSNIAATKKELVQLNKKRQLIEYSNILASRNVNIPEMNTAFAQLIPSKEDYFSIVNALETISGKTGFLIDSYQITLGQNNKRQLNLIVTGHGDSEAFLKFLKDYQFSGGRLITIDEIKFDNSLADSIKLNLHFYTSEDKKTNALSTFSAKDLSTLQKIQTTTEGTANSSTEDSSIFYKTKKNPF